MVTLIPIILAFVLSIVYIISNKISTRTERYHEHILSLGSGMLLAIIFSEVIPELIDAGTKFLSSEMISLFMLSGFVGYHLIEKYTYKHVKTNKGLVKELGYLHVGGFFVDNFLEGLVLVLLFGLTTVENLLVYVLFVPLLLGDIAASITLNHLNDRFRLGKIGITILSLSIVFGAMVGSILNLQAQSFYIALAIITGIFIYFVTRDELPRGRKGKPKLFLIGLLSVLILFFLIRRVI